MYSLQRAEPLPEPPARKRTRITLLRMKPVAAAASQARWPGCPAICCRVLAPLSPRKPVILAGWGGSRGARRPGLDAGTKGMHIVTIAADADEKRVFDALSEVGRAWRPPYDIPRLVYVDGGDGEVIASLPGVAACHEAAEFGLGPAGSDRER